MLIKIQEYLKGLLMMSSSGFVTILCVGIVFISCILGAYFVDKIFPSALSRIIEDDLEDIAECEIEQVTHLPKGSLKKEIDMIFPNDK